MSDTTDVKAQLQRAATALKDMRARLEAAESARREPVAIVGMGCRFPGAATPKEYWALLRDGVDAITETPVERWDADALYDADPEAAGRVAVRVGGFLDGIDRFDATYFGIAPREAALMDPQQRLLLEVAVEAFEDGGQPTDRLAGTRTGVFVGVHSHSSDYYLLQAGDPRRLDLYSGTGTSHSVVSGRLSYLLDLRGPSLAIDTACSSSLVAAHLAVQSLRRGECELALVAGVNLLLDPTSTILASRMRMMSERGRCQPFDAAADGFVRSEGCGAIVLKRLRDATAAGDRVLAVIEGSAVNQDGRSNGLTAPNSLSQQAVITEALADAGVGPAAIGLLEAHGTGTPLGDPIEIEALAAVFASAGAGGLVTLGSAKANVGHLEGAAGIAGLMKAVLSLQHEQVPPLLHFHRLNPLIDLAGTPLEIPTALRAWPEGQDRRRAGVSSFGWSGTNAHVIVGEAPTAEPRAAGSGAEPFVLPVAARSPGALATLAALYAETLRDPSAAPADVCATAARRRSHHPHRLAAVGRTPAELTAALDAAAIGQPHPSLATARGVAGRSLVVFVFAGQGGQWAGMGRGLLASEPAFRNGIERCEAAFAPYVDWSLTAVLAGTGADLDDIDVVQPALFAVQVAQAALWRSWGVGPDAVVGHSMGEVAAAHVAGILGLDDAARVICRRSALLRRICGLGAMAVVDLSVADAEAALAGREDRLAVAVSNSPGSTVLSGDPDALDAVLAELAMRDVFCRRVKVDVASHSPQVDVLHDDLVSALAGIDPQPAVVPFLSSVTGCYEGGPGLGAEYWARNLRQPVQFAAATRRLLDDGHGRFVELGPHPVLLTAVAETAGDRGATTIACTQRDSDEPVGMRHALAALYADGHEVDWDAVVPGPFRPADLPPYPWQHQRFWLEVSDPPAARRGAPAHPRLGWEQSVADPGAGRVWEAELTARDVPVPARGAAGEPLVPAAVLAEALTAAAAAVGAQAVVDVAFDEPLALPADAVTLQTIVNVGSGTVGLFRRAGGAWVRLTHGRLSPTAPSPVVAGMVEVPVAAAGGLGAAFAAALAAAGPARPRLPVGAAALHLAAGAGPPARALVRTDSSLDGDVVTAAVRLVDADGSAVAAVDGLRLAPADRAGERVDGWSYRIEWHVPPMAIGTRCPAAWLVVGDEAGTGSALAATLVTGGASCQVVAPGTGVEGFERLLAAADGDELGIVYLAGLDASSAGVDAALAGTAEDHAAGGFLDLLTALVQTGRRARLYVVTAGAQPVGGHDLAVLQAPLIGLARSLAEELPDLFGGSVDLDPGAPLATAVAELAEELVAGGGEPEVARRGGRRLVPRLVAEDLAPTAPLVLRADAAYLVTGAFGGLGREVARWLVARGARRLVLMGRTELPPRASWAGIDPAGPVGQRVVLVKELEAAGTTVHLASLDVGDEAGLRAWLEQYEHEGYPSIRGVVHAAAVFERQLLGTLDPSGLRDQLRPKMVGAWLLDALLGELDLFVLFSSIAALLPQPGQGAYVAGNAFLDALAHQRARRGRPALSVNWGIWADSGSVEKWRRPIEQMEAQGFHEFRFDQGLAGLERMLAGPHAQLLFTPVDWARYGATRPAGPLVADLVAGAAAAGEASRAAGPSTLRDRLAVTVPEERLDAMAGAVRHVAAHVLRLPEAGIPGRQPLGELGLDSLMGVELRNRLEAELGTKLSATLAWNYPTVDDLAAYLLGRLGYDEMPAPAAGAPVPAHDHGSFAELVAATGQLDDEQVIAALVEGAGR